VSGSGCVRFHWVAICSENLQSPVLPCGGPDVSGRGFET